MRWTKIELQKLAYYAGHVSIAEAAAQFPGRTKSGVIQKAAERGLKWKDRRVHVSAQVAARVCGVGVDRLLRSAACHAIGSRYGTRHAFTASEVERIAFVLAVENGSHPEFELYYCRRCGRETFKPWGWRWKSDAYVCSHRPLCHRCRVVARTTNRRESSYVLASASRRANRAAREIARLSREVLSWDQSTVGNHT